MNLVDSSAWLEYFAGGHNAGFFAGAIQGTPRLIVPTISILEVFKRVLQQRGRYSAYQAVAHMRLGKVIDLDRRLAISAARIGVELKLAMADSIILATARAHGATVWTQDADFEGIKGVQFRPKKSK